MGEHCIFKNGILSGRIVYREKQAKQRDDTTNKKREEDYNITKVRLVSMKSGDKVLVSQKKKFF